MKSALAILTLLLSAVTCLADGKLYARDRVPPDIPYQRAVILHHDGKETLVLQSKFQAPGAVSTNAAFGWVIPLPSVPELASMSDLDAWRLFRLLGMLSRPRVTQLGEAISFALLLVLLAGCAISILTWLLSFFVPQVKVGVSRHRLLARFAVYGLLFFLLVALLTPSLIKARGASGVDVLSSQEVGIYDTKVIKSNSSADLIAWLSENGFNFTPADAPVLDHYIQADWCFVVAKVRPEEVPGLESDFDGLIDPIIMRFDAPSPVYPLALTSTIGVSTEVLIYLVSDTKMACGDRMALRFAGDFDAELLNHLRMESPPPFCQWETNLSYLCKFKANFTPAQMQADMTFVPALDNEAFREHIIEW